MKIDYINNSDDIANFKLFKLLNSPYYKHKQKYSKYYLLIGLLFICIFEYFVTNIGLFYFIRDILFKNYIIHIFIIGEIVVIIFPKLYHKFLKFSLKEYYKNYNRNATMIIDPNGIIDESEDISYALCWCDVDKAIVIDQYIFIYLKSNNLMIPVDTFDSLEDKEKFLQILSENIGDRFDNSTYKSIKPKFSMKNFAKELSLIMGTISLFVVVGLTLNEALTHKNSLITKEGFALFSEYNKVSDNIPKVQNILEKFPQLKIYVTHGLEKKLNNYKVIKFQSVDGLYENNNIYISGFSNDSTTLFHELGHAVDAYMGCYLETGYAGDDNRFKLSSNDDFKKLYEKYKNTSIFTEYGRNPSSDTTKCLSEGFAEMFANYISDRNKVDKEVATYFDNIVKIINALKPTEVVH
ncbi:YcxB family protein [Inconstantimicrobium mannanitabidum]|uniref:Uncharacterized protein n=1 Tax=Inconstantimicrobium mannanitabidum TaxID=1604901 RepID=A0ACB5RIR0_9CLOT|nr:YcxB family protein [Clostridium sp. TW13]GKX68962.1 hypothetical protein rsdtw13_42200 [Clostridium sp. TW13]